VCISVMGIRFGLRIPPCVRSMQAAEDFPRETREARRDWHQYVDPPDDGKAARHEFVK